MGCQTVNHTETPQDKHTLSFIEIYTCTCIMYQNFTHTLREREREPFHMSNTESIPTYLPTHTHTHTHVYTKSQTAKHQKHILGLQAFSYQDVDKGSLMCAMILVHVVYTGGT